MTPIASEGLVLWPVKRAHKRGGEYEGEPLNWGGLLAAGVFKAGSVRVCAI